MTYDDEYFRQPGEQMLVIDEGFERDAALGRQLRAEGFKTNPDGVVLHGWESLSSGKTVGKAVTIDFNSAGNFLQVGQDMLEVGGDTKDGLALSVILGTPKIAKRPAGSFDASQFGGPWQDNVEVLQTFQTDPNFYGVGGNGPLTSNVQAEIQWGIGGVNHKAIVDMCNGAGATISASWVRIRALINNDNSNGQSLLYQCAAQVSPGHSKWLSAQFTQPLSDWDTNEETVVFAIPRFARRVNLLGLNNSATPGPLFQGSIRFWRNPNGPGLGTQRVGEYLFVGNAANSVPLPIPNGAYYYTVVSQLATPNDLFAVFDLAI